MFVIPTTPDKNKTLVREFFLRFDNLDINESRDILVMSNRTTHPWQSRPRESPDPPGL
jgi:hypothetical protein